MQAYFTVAESFCYEKVIEKSKFIANFARIEQEQEGRAFVQQVAKQHPFATHNCYAMIVDKVGQLQRFSDDGEPQGTAGLPMLEVLKSKKIYQVVAVVTRYFGGIKLGAGGLVRAYTSTVAEGLTQDKLCQYIQSQLIQLHIGYENFTAIKGVLQKANNCSVLHIEYGNSIVIQIAIPLMEYVDILKQCNNILAGKLQYNLKAIDYLPYYKKENLLWKI